MRVFGGQKVHTHDAKIRQVEVDDSMAKAPVKQEKPAVGWYTREQMAAILDVSEQQFDRLYRKLVPADGVKTIHRRPYFHARALVDTLVSRSRSTAVADGDPLMGDGPDSPALERYREGRADLVEMD